MTWDIVVIGGGAGGLSAALAAHEEDVRILVLEREAVLGGILNQCIHNGFGLHEFEEDLTGPEYADRFIAAFYEKGIDVYLGTTVMNMTKTKEGFSLEAFDKKAGKLAIEARAVILSSGCYERTRGQIRIPGERPAGVMTAGSAQRYLNIEGYLVGKEVFILGSGDIGLIMARRMTLEGANVKGVAEIMPHSNGLTRNIAQCLEDFDIPLYLSHTVTDIRGVDRLEGITIEEVDKDFRVIEGTKKDFAVDCLLLSVGLIPDTMVLESLDVKMHPKTKGPLVDHNFHTNVEGLFACGNALHVHDLVDDVTEESRRAARCAKEYVHGKIDKDGRKVEIHAGEGISYTVPSALTMSSFDRPVRCAFRVDRKADRAVFRLTQNNETIATKKARFVAPAEMEHVELGPKDLKDTTSPITLTMEVV